MASRLVGAQPLSEPMLECNQSNSWEQTFKKTYLKIFSVKSRPFCLGLSVLKYVGLNAVLISCFQIYILLSEIIPITPCGSMAGFDQCTMSRGIVVFDINLEHVYVSVKSFPLGFCNVSHYYCSPQTGWNSDWFDSGALKLSCMVGDIKYSSYYKNILLGLIAPSSYTHVSFC